MKKINKLIGIFNIIHYIILLSLKPLSYFLMVYPSYLKFLTDYMILIMSFANLIIAIKNIIKKNKKVAFTQFLIGMYYIFLSIANEKKWYIFGLLIFTQSVIFLIFDKNKLNRKISIINIVHCILCVLAINYYILDVLEIFIFIVVILNTYASIKNFNNNEKFIALIQIIIPVYYSFYYIPFLKNGYLMITFLIIASIIMFIFNMNYNHTEKVSRLYSIPIYLLICINIIAILIPVRMNLTNVKNFEKNISRFEREISGKKYSLNQDEKINEQKYDKVYLKAFEIKFKGKKIYLGFAINDNEVVIVNSKGVKMTTLCSSGFGFQEDYGIPFLFFTYLSTVPKYEIEIPEQETMFWVR